MLPEVQVIDDSFGLQVHKCADYFYLNEKTETYPRIIHQSAACCKPVVAN